MSRSRIFSYKSSVPKSLIMFLIIFVSNFGIAPQVFAIPGIPYACKNKASAEDREAYVCDTLTRVNSKRKELADNLERYLKILESNNGKKALLQARKEIRNKLQNLQEICKFDTRMEDKDEDKDISDCRRYEALPACKVVNKAYKMLGSKALDGIPTKRYLSLKGLELALQVLRIREAELTSEGYLCGQNQDLVEHYSSCSYAQEELTLSLRMYSLYPHYLNPQDPRLQKFKSTMESVDDIKRGIEQENKIRSFDYSGSFPCPASSNIRSRSNFISSLPRITECLNDLYQTTPTYNKKLAALPADPQVFSMPYGCEIGNHLFTHACFGKNEVEVPSLSPPLSLAAIMETCVVDPWDDYRLSEILGETEWSDGDCPSGTIAFDSGYQCNYDPLFPLRKISRCCKVVNRGT